MRNLLRALVSSGRDKWMVVLAIAVTLAMAPLPQHVLAQTLPNQVVLTEVKIVNGTPPGQAPLTTQFNVVTSCNNQPGGSVNFGMNFSYIGGANPWSIYNHTWQIPATCTTQETLPPPFINAAGQTCTWQLPVYTPLNPLTFAQVSPPVTLTISNSYVCGPAQPAGATLKVCKILNGAVQGTPFTFSYSSSAGSGTLPSIPGTAAPGTCVVGPTLPVGTNVTVTETGPSGYAVTGVTGVPAPTGTVGSTTHTILVAGINELTFTNIGTKGYLEICKVAGPTVAIGTPFQFTVSGSQYTVAAGPGPNGYCSPPIAVTAGQVVIAETPSNHPITSCTMLPNASACPFTSTTATVTVNAGGIADQTIAVITDN